MESEAEPPAYTPTLSAQPTTTSRTIEDTRALILSNAQILRPGSKNLPDNSAVPWPKSDNSNISIVIGKAKPPIPQASSSRNFTHSASNTTVRIAEPAENGGSSSARSRQASVAAEPTPTRQQGKHYAALVSRSSSALHSSSGLHLILRGEPQDTIEEALEWLLDRTEIIVAEMLERHAKQLPSGCCGRCDGLLGFEPVDKTQLAGWKPVDRTQLAGWRS